MPELPEVETIRLGLQQYLVGHIIEHVDVRLPKMVSGDTKPIIDAKVTAVRRFGKGLVIDLNNQYSIAVHVKMTGQLIYRDAKVEKVVKVAEGRGLSEKVGGALPNRSTHVIFKLSSSRHSGNPPDGGASRISKGVKRSWASQDDEIEAAYLYYNDIRQFGWIKITKTDEVQNLPFFKDLGPEPNVIDYSSSERSESRSDALSMSKGSRPFGLAQGGQARTILTLEMFKQLLKKAKTAVKPYIMDQKVISGIGNIYANDALFDAGIDPRRPANTLSEEESERLLKSIEKVLKKGLEVGGSSEWQYVNALGQEGGYQKIFKVYNKKKCTKCGGDITKITLGGRGTSFCEVCQK